MSGAWLRLRVRRGVAWTGGGGAAMMENHRIVAIAFPIQNEVSSWTGAGCWSSGRSATSSTS